LYPIKLSFIIDGEIKTFHEKQKLKQVLTTQASTAKDTTHRRRKSTSHEIMEKNKYLYKRIRKESHITKNNKITGITTTFQK
jgi:hypothetical protein